MEMQSAGRDVSPALPRVAIALILVLAGILRAGMLYRTDSTSFLRDDGLEYKDIARQLAAGHGFSVSSYRWYEPVPPDKAEYHADVFRPPLLPILGAPLFWLPIEWERAARVEVFVIGMLLVIMAILLAAEIAGNVRWAAPLSGLLFAVHPSVLHYSRKFSTEQLAALCILVSLYTFIRTLKGPEARRWGFFCGMALALSTLARSNLFLTAMFFLVATAWLAFRSNLLARRALLPMLAGIVLLLSPWSIRQGLVGAGWQPVSAFGPYAYWMGNHPDELASYQTTDSKEFLRLQDVLNLEDTHEVLHQMEEEKLFQPAQTGPYWLKVAFAWQREHPADAAKLIGYRMLHFFRPWPSALAFPLWQVVFIGTLNCAVLALALYWFYRKGNGWTQGGAVWLCVASNAIGAIPFIFTLRYRFPSTEVPLLVVTGAGLALLVQRRVAKTGDASIANA